MTFSFVHTRPKVVTEKESSGKKATSNRIMILDIFHNNELTNTKICDKISYPIVRSQLCYTLSTQWHWEIFELHQNMQITVSFLLDFTKIFFIQVSRRMKKEKKLMLHISSFVHFFLVSIFFFIFFSFFVCFLLLITRLDGEWFSKRFLIIQVDSLLLWNNIVLLTIKNWP